MHTHPPCVRILLLSVVFAMLTRSLRKASGSLPLSVAMATSCCRAASAASRYPEGSGGRERGRKTMQGVSNRKYCCCV
jgi:hypothetical protein